MNFRQHLGGFATSLRYALLSFSGEISVIGFFKSWDLRHFGKRKLEGSVLSDVISDAYMSRNNTHESYENLVDFTLSGIYNLDKPVLIDASDPSRFITKRRAVDIIAKFSGAFEKDSTVCLHLSNEIVYPVLVLGILASKCHCTGTNPAYTQHELEHHFRISRTKYVITMPEHLETIQAAIRLLDSPIEVILFIDLQSTGTSLSPCGSNCPKRHGEKQKGFRTLHDLLKEPKSVKMHTQVGEIRAADVAALMSTSGTTGLPKMAARTHRAMIEELEAIEDNNSDKPYDVRRLFCTPIFHAFSTPEMVFNPLRLGYPTYFMKRFDDTYAQKVHDFGITETAAPPPMLIKLQQLTEANPLLQSLRLIFCGGAPLATENRLRTLEMFKIKPRIVPVWGMTEGGWFSTLRYPEDDDTNSVGRAIPGYEIKVSEEGSLELDNGHMAGELLIRGPQLMTGYLGNAQASRDAFADGWLKTGDIGYIQQGKIYIVDRTKDLIKVNGWQVAQAELESVLLTSPDILDAAAISAGHGVDEHPMLFVVLTMGVHMSASEVEDHLRSRLARYKVAPVAVEFVEAIPRNPSGKILRKVLRMRVIEQGSRQVSHV